jgi:hypothetical protein
VGWREVGCERWGGKRWGGERWGEVLPLPLPSLPLPPPPAPHLGVAGDGVDGLALALVAEVGSGHEDTCALLDHRPEDLLLLHRCRAKGVTVKGLGSWGAAGAAARRGRQAKARPAGHHSTQARRGRALPPPPLAGVIGRPEPSGAARGGACAGQGRRRPEEGRVLNPAAAPSPRRRSRSAPWGW